MTWRRKTNDRRGAWRTRQGRLTASSFAMHSSSLATCGPNVLALRFFAFDPGAEIAASDFKAKSSSGPIRR